MNAPTEAVRIGRKAGPFLAILVQNQAKQCLLSIVICKTCADDVFCLDQPYHAVMLLSIPHNSVALFRLPLCSVQFCWKHIHLTLQVKSWLVAALLVHVLEAFEDAVREIDNLGEDGAKERKGSLARCTCQESNVNRESP